MNTLPDYTLTTGDLDRILNILIELMGKVAADDRATDKQYGELVNLSNKLQQYLYKRVV